MLQLVQLHRRELLVAGLADAVHERGYGDPLLLRTQVLVQLEEFLVDLGDERLTLLAFRDQIGVDLCELVDGITAGRLDLPDPRLG